MVSQWKVGKKLDSCSSGLILRNYDKADYLKDAVIIFLIQDSEPLS